MSDEKKIVAPVEPEAVKETADKPQAEEPKAEVAEDPVPDYLHTLIDEIAVREGFAAGYSVQSVSGASIGDGFQSLMFRTTIEGRRNGQADQRLQLICKIPPRMEMRRQLSAPSFRGEVFAYETLLPQLTTLQRDHGINDQDGFYTFPKCYGTFSDDANSEYAIVLEDLKLSGCRMWNKFETMDMAHARLILTELGKYHALSFALREQQPELLKKYSGRTGGMFEAIIAFPPAMAFYNNTFNRALGVLDGEKDAALKVKVEKVRDNMIELLRAVGTGALAEPFAVVGHGDCWNNNMMFRYSGEDSSKLEQVCIIDWQMGQYVSPITDLTYFLYSSTEQKLRDEHFDEMLDVYHSSLTGLLQKLGCDAERLFSRAHFDRQLKDFALYALIMAPMLVQIVTVVPEDIPDMDSEGSLEDVANFEFISKDASKYEVRMRDVLRDFDARGYFESKHNIY